MGMWATYVPRQMNLKWVFHTEGNLDQIHPLKRCQLLPGVFLAERIHRDTNVTTVSFCVHFCSGSFLLTSLPQDLFHLKLLLLLVYYQTRA